MAENETVYSHALAQIASTDFDRARRKAFFNELESILTRRPGALVSFEQVERMIPIQGHYYKGMFRDKSDLQAWPLSYVKFSHRIPFLTIL